MIIIARAESENKQWQISTDSPEALKEFMDEIVEAATEGEAIRCEFS